MVSIIHTFVHWILKVTYLIHSDSIFGLKLCKRSAKTLGKL